METLNPENVIDILRLIEDGFLFEEFGQEFLSARLGYSFLASGGIKDRGIDGLEYISELESDSKRIFQISINKQPKSKIFQTIDTLHKNDIEFKALTYVTNIKVKNKEKIIDSCLDEKEVNLQIFDGLWIAHNANNSPATQNVIHSFIRNHLREYQRPGKGLIISDYVKNPTLYTFLMQQVGNNDEIVDINTRLIDSLIIYVLRDTDPDEDKFLDANEIFQEVSKLFEINIRKLKSKINKRLSILSKKPRKINHHRNIDKYCLPYEARLRVLKDNANDKFLYDKFYEETTRILKINLKAEKVELKNLSTLIQKIIEKLYYKQGLEFADFLLNRGVGDVFEHSLEDTVDEILNESKIIQKYRQKIKSILIVTIREIIYHGSEDIKLYLKQLSKTYLMLFLLKCDPKIVDFFQSLAGNLKVYICTSILVPAFSEIYLEPQNKRYWNLLKAAQASGVNLIVNDSIISELAFHINRSKYIFDSYYKDNIDFFTDFVEELVDQILVRAYIYAFKEKKICNYDQFLDNFITVNGKNTKQELIDFLYEEFGIKYLSDEELDVKIDDHDLKILVDELKKFKGSEEKATTDARLALTIYAIRKKNGEERSTLDGYRTWWLSSDTMTHRTISNIFKDKFPVSCYMRPDFLYNYITLIPKHEDVSRVYNKVFPNLLGIQISNHISPEIISSFREIINQHSDKLDGRRKAKIRQLIDELKSNSHLNYQEKLISFFQ